MSADGLWGRRAGDHARSHGQAAPAQRLHGAPNPATYGTPASPFHTSKHESCFSNPQSSRSQFKVSTKRSRRFPSRTARGVDRSRVSDSARGRHECGVDGDRGRRRSACVVGVQRAGAPRLSALRRLPEDACAGPGYRFFSGNLGRDEAAKLSSDGLASYPEYCTLITPKLSSRLPARVIHASLWKPNTQEPGRN